MLSVCLSRQKLVVYFSQIWVQQDNPPSLLRLLIGRTQLQPARAVLKHSFSYIICQQTDRRQTNRDGHQWAEVCETLIKRENWFLGQLNTSRLLSRCGMPRYLGLRPSRQWTASQVCSRLPSASQTVFWKDARACTNTHHMPPAHQTGIQSRPTGLVYGQWLK